MREDGIDSQNLDYVVFYDKTFLIFERLLMSYLAVAPKGLRSWLESGHLLKQEHLQII